MKKNIIAAAMLAAALTLSSCTASEANAPAGYTEISDEGLNYHFYVPSSWTPDISTGMTSAYYSGRDPSNVSITAFELDDVSINSVDAYWELNEADLKLVLPNLEYVDISDTTLGGANAKQYTYTSSMSDTDYKFMQVVAIRSNEVYIFTYTATSENYDSHIEDVISMIDYFEFK